MPYSQHLNTSVLYSLEIGSGTTQKETEKGTMKEEEAEAGAAVKEHTSLQGQGFLPC